MTFSERSTRLVSVSASFRRRDDSRRVRTTRRFVTTRRRQAGETGTLADEARVIDAIHDAVHDRMHFLYGWLVFLRHRHGVLLRGRGASGQTRVKSVERLDRDVLCSLCARAELDYFIEEPRSIIAHRLNYVTFITRALS